MDWTSTFRWIKPLWRASKRYSIILAMRPLYTIVPGPLWRVQYQDLIRSYQSNTNKSKPYIEWHWKCAREQLTLYLWYLWKCLMMWYGLFVFYIWIIWDSTDLTENEICYRGKHDAIFEQSAFFPIDLSYASRSVNKIQDTKKRCLTS
jgi:hypothetical protein